MASVFSKIIAGELPGRFVWREDDVVAFLTIAPLRLGHTLVVPRQEVDQWTEADGALFDRCTAVARVIGQAVRRAFGAPRAGLIVAGFEVEHLHLHVFPTWGEAEFNFARADRSPRPEDMDDAADRVRVALRELGHAAHVAS